MSVRAMSWAYSQRVGNPGRKLILVTLADHADDEGLAWPSVPRISEYSEVSERTVREHLVALEEMGLIVREEGWRSDGGRTSNRYRLQLHRPHVVAGTPPAKSAGGGTAKSAGAPPQDSQGPPAKSAGAGEPPTGVPLEPSVEPSVERGAALEFDELRSYLGPDLADQVLPSWRSRPGWSPREDRSLLSQWGPGGLDPTAWKDDTGSLIPEADRPRLLSLVLIRMAGESQRLHGRLFRRVLQAVIQEQQGGHGARASPTAVNPRVRETLERLGL